VALGAGLVFAHFQGLLDPAYHAFGLNGNGPGAGQPGQEAKTPAGHAGHAGHGGAGPQGAGGEPSKLPGYSVVTILPERQQLIGVRTGKVERGRLRMSIRAVGVVEADQTHLARIHSRVRGWVTKVHVNFVGKRVRKGHKLLEIYSPDLLATQKEYLLALKGSARRAAGGRPNLAAAAKRRLELWGVGPKEIQELEQTRKARDTLTLRAPIDGLVLERRLLEGSYIEPANELYQIVDLSTVWVQAKVYEYELAHVEVGQPVHVTFQSLPGKTFHRQVSFVEPVLQEATRTVKVRVALANPAGLFRPGMYADLQIDHDMGTGLLVPETALLRTGKRAIAFRSLPGGRFEPVEVTPGARFGERVQVKGLSEGDTVVTSAVFLIDAESRLKSAVSMPGHQHGSGAGKKTDSAPAKPHDHGSRDVPQKEENHEGHDHHH
jgi:Cu(I)/Ag(I) efflux system membrane fusion protein